MEINPAFTAFVAVMALTLILSVIPVTHALPSSGSLYISIPNSSITCANIVLPDDGGFFGRAR